MVSKVIIIDNNYVLSLRPSTEELVRNQTDWLKEFRQSVPLLSQLRSVGGASGVTSSTLAPLPQPLHVPAQSHTTQLGASFLASRRPRLILDSSDNIKLVHV